VLISDYNVIRDVVSETCGGRVSVLSYGASPLRFSHVVKTSFYKVGVLPNVPIFIPNYRI
jgi:hypothetical protein